MTDISNMFVQLFSVSDPNMYYLWLVILSIIARGIFILRPLVIIAKRFGGVRSVRELWKDFRNEFNPALKPVYTYILYEIIWTILPLIPLFILRFGFLPEPQLLTGSFDELLILIPCAVAWIGLNFIVIFKAGDPIDKMLKALNHRLIRSNTPKITRFSVLALSRSRRLIQSVADWTEQEYQTIKPKPDYQEIIETEVHQSEGLYSEDSGLSLRKVFSNVKEAGRVSAIVGQNSAKLVVNQLKKGAKLGADKLDKQVNLKIEELFRIEKNRWDRIFTETALNFLPLFAIYVILPLYG